MGTEGSGRGGTSISMMEKMFLCLYLSECNFTLLFQKTIFVKLMKRVGKNFFASHLLILCVAIAMAVLSACDSSADASGDTDNLTTLSSSSKGKCSSSKANISTAVKSYPDSFKPNDKEYPYASIPRIVIYTENKQKIKDRETEIPAKLQIWGKKEAESEVLDLTIRGRGNTSWIMPKKSYKIEFIQKQSMLGMPKDKDWALIANYADKSLMRNYIAYRLSAGLGAYYAPRCEFVELYLNDVYLGVYLLTETIKISKNRVGVPEDDNSFVVEVDGKYRKNEQIVFSDVLTENGTEKAFRIHYPKNASRATLDTVQNHIRNFEKFLKSIKARENNSVDDWIDIDESVKHYWIQELFKNPDACFYTSVFFSWVKGKKIMMGPVWDFDLSMANHSSNSVNKAESWQIRNYWNAYLFKDSLYRESIRNAWKMNHDLFESVSDSIDNAYAKIKKAAQNNFKKWNVLGDTTSSSWKNQTFTSYKESVVYIKNWLSDRIQWIDGQE